MNEMYGSPLPERAPSRQQQKRPGTVPNSSAELVSVHFDGNASNISQRTSMNLISHAEPTLIVSSDGSIHISSKTVISLVDSVMKSVKRELDEQKTRFWTQTLNRPETDTASDLAVSRSLVSVDENKAVFDPNVGMDELRMGAAAVQHVREYRQRLEGFRHEFYTVLSQSFFTMLEEEAAFFETLLPKDLEQPLLLRSGKEVLQQGQKSAVRYMIALKQVVAAKLEEANRQQKTNDILKKKLERNTRIIEKLRSTLVKEIVALKNELFRKQREGENFELEILSLFDMLALFEQSDEANQNNARLEIIKKIREDQEKLKALYEVQYRKEIERRDKQISKVTKDFEQRGQEIARLQSALAQMTSLTTSMTEITDVANVPSAMAATVTSEAVGSDSPIDGEPPGGFSSLAAAAAAFSSSLKKQSSDQSPTEVAASMEHKVRAQAAHLRDLEAKVRKYQEDSMKNDVQVQSLTRQLEETKALKAKEMDELRLQVARDTAKLKREMEKKESEFALKKIEWQKDSRVRSSQKDVLFVKEKDDLLKQVTKLTLEVQELRSRVYDNSDASIPGGSVVSVKNVVSVDIDDALVRSRASTPSPESKMFLHLDGGNPNNMQSAGGSKTEKDAAGATSKRVFSALSAGRDGGGSVEKPGGADSSRSSKSIASSPSPVQFDSKRDEESAASHDKGKKLAQGLVPKRKSSDPTSRADAKKTTSESLPGSRKPSADSKVGTSALESSVSEALAVKIRQQQQREMEYLQIEVSNLSDQLKLSQAIEANLSASVEDLTHRLAERDFEVSQLKKLGAVPFAMLTTQTDVARGDSNASLLSALTESTKTSPQATDPQRQVLLFGPLVTETSSSCPSPQHVDSESDGPVGRASVELKIVPEDGERKSGSPFTPPHSHTAVAGVSRPVQTETSTSRLVDKLVQTSTRMRLDQSVQVVLWDSLSASQAKTLAAMEDFRNEAAKGLRVSRVSGIRVRETDGVREYVFDCPQCTRQTPVQLDEVWHRNTQTDIDADGLRNLVNRAQFGRTTAPAATQGKTTGNARQKEHEVERKRDQQRQHEHERERERERVRNVKVGQEVLREMIALTAGQPRARSHEIREQATRSPSVTFTESSSEIEGGTDGNISPTNSSVSNLSLGHHPSETMDDGAPTDVQEDIVDYSDGEDPFEIPQGRGSISNVGNIGDLGEPLSSKTGMHVPLSAPIHRPSSAIVMSSYSAVARPSSETLHHRSVDALNRPSETDIYGYRTSPLDSVSTRPLSSASSSSVARSLAAASMSSTAAHTVDLNNMFNSGLAEDEGMEEQKEAYESDPSQPWSDTMQERILRRLAPSIAATTSKVMMQAVGLQLPLDKLSDPTAVLHSRRSSPDEHRPHTTQRSQRSSARSTILQAKLDAEAESGLSIRPVQQLASSLLRDRPATSGSPSNFAWIKQFANDHLAGLQQQQQQPQASNLASPAHFGYAPGGAPSGSSSQQSTFLLQQMQFQQQQQHQQYQQQFSQQRSSMTTVSLHGSSMTDDLAIDTRRTSATGSSRDAQQRKKGSARDASAGDSGQLIPMLPSMSARPLLGGTKKAPQKIVPDPLLDLALLPDPESHSLDVKHVRVPSSLHSRLWDALDHAQQSQDVMNAAKRPGSRAGNDRVFDGIHGPLPSVTPEDLVIGGGNGRRSPSPTSSAAAAAFVSSPASSHSAGKQPNERSQSPGPNGERKVVRLRMGRAGVDVVESSEIRQW
eukprot:ANDGO_07518.mRNA.1 hypothetical protein